MTIKCKYCGDTKPEDHMKLRGGKPSKVCKSCDEEKALERARLRGIVAGARGARKTKRKKASKKRVKSDPVELRVTFPGGGLGFDAFLTKDDRLQITQENEGAEADNVVLNKRETRSILEKFGDWADVDA